jgi:hypothetical protein
MENEYIPQLASVNANIQPAQIADFKGSDNSNSSQFQNGFMQGIQQVQQNQFNGKGVSPDPNFKV